MKLFSDHATTRLRFRVKKKPTPHVMGEIKARIAAGDYEYICPSYNGRRIIAVTIDGKRLYAVCAPDSAIVTLLTKHMVRSTIKDQRRRAQRRSL